MRLGAGALLAAAALAASAAGTDWRAALAPSTVDAKAFTAAVIGAIAERDPRLEARAAGRLQIEVAPAGGAKSMLFLDNLYRSLGPPGPARAARVEHYLDAVLGSVAHLSVVPADLPRLRPVVRSASFVRQSDAADGGRHGIVADPLVGDLFVLYVIDRGDHVAYLNRDEIAKLGIARSKLRATAIANFAANAGDVRVMGSGSAYLLVLDGTYESSLLLVDSVWRQLAKTLGGDLAVAVPARDAVYVARADDAAAVARLRTAAVRVAGHSAYPISTQLLRWHDGAWKPFDQSR